MKCLAPSRSRTAAASWVSVAVLGVFACSPPPAEDELETISSDGMETDSSELSVGDPAPLRRIAVPAPIGGDVVDQAAAIRLGKALFWDVQVGSDGNTACATCHFNAGTDNRIVNAVNPGPDGRFQTTPGPGHRHNGNSVADDAIGSQGVMAQTFTSLSGGPVDRCTPRATSWTKFRQVTRRNAPSVVGAVFNHQLFWDGRANNDFNGLDPFGNTANATSALVRVARSALASQAVGPPDNDAEMACSGRQFNGPNSLGAKLVDAQALALQRVHATDGVLGAYAAANANGLRCGTVNCTYRMLVIDAFGSTLANDAVNQFSRIWGQAIAAYEATLVPDDTPFDRYLAGNTSAITASQRRGFEVFKGSGKCIVCHAGSELTDASVSFLIANGPVNSQGGDQGFHNIGSRPSAEDLGRAGAGPRGVSYANSSASANRGAFKTPGLRNVRLTAPYMHDGSLPSIRGVVEFYRLRGTFPNHGEKSPIVGEIRLTGHQPMWLIDFLENSLTDCRVERRRAPFDHPSLPLPNGVALAAVGAAGTGRCR